MKPRWLNFAKRNPFHRKSQRRRAVSLATTVTAEVLEVRILLSATFGDFNGDGYQDMAVAAPGEENFDSFGMALSGAGAVHVVYGSAEGLQTDAPPPQIWTLASLGHAPAAGDQFGAALAVGNFNGDVNPATGLPIDDLAVGIAGRDLAGLQDVGAVSVIYGTTGGLRATGSQYWSQESPGIADQAEQLDRFGAALTGGDFDGDGYTDLAIGAPGENYTSYDAVVPQLLQTKYDAGAVHVIYGASGGLVAARSQLWNQDSESDGGNGIWDQTEPYDQYGAVLAAGNFNNDVNARTGLPIDDLAVGIPGEEVGTQIGAGAINIIHGSHDGLSQRYDDQFWHGVDVGVGLQPLDDADAWKFYGADWWLQHRRDLDAGAKIVQHFMKLFASLTPGLGFLMAGYEMGHGTDIFGNPVSIGDQVLNTLGFGLPIAAATVPALVSGVQNLARFGKRSKVARNADDLGRTAKIAKKAGDTGGCFVGETAVWYYEPQRGLILPDEAGGLYLPETFDDLEPFALGVAALAFGIRWRRRRRKRRWAKCGVKRLWLPDESPPSDEDLPLRLWLPDDFAASSRVVTCGETCAESQNESSINREKRFDECSNQVDSASSLDATEVSNSDTVECTVPLGTEKLSKMKRLISKLTTPVFWLLCLACLIPTSLRLFAPSTATSTAPQETIGRLAKKPIREMQVGTWVMAGNPTGERDESLGLEVDPLTWRKIELRAPKADGSHADVTLLRPLEWIQFRNITIGESTYISVPECGIDGNATVLAVGPCPTIGPAPGEGFQVVTGKFTHHSATVLDLKIEGLSLPIGTTANHPIWSEDRQQFVRADQLLPGERLRAGCNDSCQPLTGTPASRRGPPSFPRLVSATERPGRHAVYNLEVSVDHTYHVSSGGLLVHNGNNKPCPKFIKRVRDLKKQGLSKAQRHKILEKEFPTSTNTGTHSAKMG